MHRLRLILISQLILLTILPNSQTVRIGLAKPWPITSPMPPTTTSEASTEEPIAETVSDMAEYATVTMKTTTSIDIEWPDFPPKKSVKTSNKTTTEKPSTTTVEPTTTTVTTVASTVTVKENNTVLDPAIPVISFTNWPQKQKYCYCDLIREACDLNCCCDQDCSPEALKVFYCHLEAPLNIEWHEGRFEDFKFQHGLPSCEVNDGWLCVFRTNKPVADEQVASYTMDTSRYYKWPNLLLEFEDVKQREFYKYGDLIRIFNTETKEILNLDLPSPFESSSCRIREPLHYLKTTKKFCLITSFENLQEAKLKLLQLEEKYKIFRAPVMPEDLYNNKHLENFIGNITVNKCLKSGNSCATYKRNKENEEKYAMFKVKVNILHNFTHIQEMVVDLWFEDLKEEKYSKSFEQEYWLAYETEFFNRTSKDFKAVTSRNFSKPPIVSGPLGYLQGKPLIVARYEPFNRSQPLTTKNQILNYFAPNNSEYQHVLSLLAQENGLCKRSSSSRDFINYGINAAYYCKVRLENDSVVAEEPANINFTAKCLNLQKLIHDQLFGQDLVVEDITSYFISQLGRPQNNSNKWLQLQVYNTGFDAVLSQYLPETKTFVCRNILLSLSYEFHMATLTVDNIPLQNIIKHAVLHLDERHDLEFSLHEHLEVPVTMTVRFYDAREKAASPGSNLPKINLSFYFKFSLILLFTL